VFCRYSLLLSSVWHRVTLCIKTPRGHRRVNERGLVTPYPAARSPMAEQEPGVRVGMSLSVMYHLVSAFDTFESHFQHVARRVIIV